LLRGPYRRSVDDPDDEIAMKKPICVVRHFLASALSAWLCFSLACAQSMPAQIDIVIVDGEGSVNSPGQRVAHIPVVRVEDENHRPVPGAAVVFTLPIEGTSGEFSNGSKTLTVVTDQDGKASAQGLKTNNVSGKLQIYVTASYRGLRARNLVNQTNSGSSHEVHKSNGKVWAILALVGAAAAGGAIAATRKGAASNSSSGPSTPSVPAAIGITPGSGSISPPH
jgi:hypothetical protein